MARVTTKLPLTYEPAKLLQALEQISRFQIREEPTYSDPPIHARWGGASLHSIGGRWNDASPGEPALVGFQETELTQVAPYFKQVLDSLPCPKHSVRISVIWPNGRINPHSDWFLGFDKGLIRLHIPITTNPGVEFVVGDEPCRWQPGELWYGDFSLTHHVANQGPVPRVHLIADVCINDFIVGLFPPEFVARQPGVAKHQEAITLPRSELGTYACRFTVSGSLGDTPLAENLPLEWGLKRDFDGEVRVAGDRLVMAINGQDLIGLEPLGQDAFRMFGVPPAILLVLQREQGRVTSVSLKTPLGQLPFPLASDSRA
ncbi:aspartyl/asparaginyl beta-hydroxylase domain-containing protein [Corallococcus sp. BB11-1]|uniref:aspartyl/asparaginyl beta-hydroxylase domain-containing protein n=1 Tax=Corallococcus sp. BB11-1 TaxID=2996783 RepID=UPI00226D8A76|nr:aspartyl/asparaginyl beta-hydroxylase domain-containing protein [Corallococcus sp. BB11-1]MCY1035332.1 aspartyl/asparaginyl beta-hydroxylase domain-containing protein [Corallococcus sp. BB11-1]